MSPRDLDLTHVQRPAGIGMDTRFRWLCGHDHKRGETRKVGTQRLMWRCVNCAKGKA